MTGEDIQAMLFGTVEAPGTPADDDPGQQALRLCALNVNSAGTDRAQPLLEWLTGTRCNVLVLTELRPSDGGRLILAGLEADGFHVARTAGWQDSQYMAVVASRGFETAPVTPAPFDPRVAAVDLAAAGPQPVRVVGVYAPTNGMTAESSLRRRGFQGQFLDYLAAITRPAMCVTGDLNVVEPGHRPPLEGFEDHDYAFYARLTQSSGLCDAYRHLNPDGTDHSWASDRLGGQRLDHALVSPAAGTIRECRYDHAPRTRRLTDHAALIITVGPDAGK
jgi:exodeoxyribonuclease III